MLSWVNRADDGSRERLMVYINLSDHLTYCKKLRYNEAFISNLLVIY